MRNLLDCLGASKKEWALILLLDQEHQTPAGREIVRGDLNLLTQLDEDSGNLFDFYIPGYLASPDSFEFDIRDHPWGIRRLYPGSHLNSVGAVELKRLGMLYFSRQDFRIFYKYLEQFSKWRHSGECELVLVKRGRRKEGKARAVASCSHHACHEDSVFTELCCYNLDDIVRNGSTVNRFFRQLFIEMSQGGNPDWAIVKSRVDKVYSDLILPVDGPQTEEQAKMFDVGSCFLRRTFPVRGYVFISYSTKDAFRAWELRESLEAMGIKCWMAPRDIPTGTSYACMIAKAIGDCAMFFLLLSPNSMESVWVEKEVLLAVSKLKKEGSLYVAWCSNTDPVTFSNGFEYTLVNVQVDDLLFSEKSIDLQRVVDHYYKFNLPAVSSISPTGWVRTLREMPSLRDLKTFLDVCPWRRLTGDDWVQILSVAPSLECKIPFDALSAEDTAVLLRAFPRFVDKCEWRRIARDFCWATCRELPELVKYFPWDSTDWQPWLGLLRVFPEYADRCPWNEFISERHEEFWLKLLLARPELVKYYGNAKSLSATGWRQILRAHPELASKCDAWSIFDGVDWAYLLSRRPVLAPYCDSNDGWRKFLPDDWRFLLRYRPCFEEKRIDL